MDKPLPDKWVRKAVSDLIDGAVVDTFTIPCYDQRVTTGLNSDIPNYYTIMSTQTNEVDNSNKCGYNWQSSILIDVFTSYDLPGNPGTRLLADNILDSVKDKLQNVSLEPSSGLVINRQKMQFPADIVTTSKRQNVFRKFIRLELYIV